MKIRLTLLFVLAAVLSAACGGDLLDPAAATVSGRKIPIDEVDTALDGFTSSDGYTEATKEQNAGQLQKDFERNYLERKIRLLVFRPRAEELGIEVSDAEVSEQLDQIRAQFPSNKELETRAAQEGIGVAQLEDLVLLTLFEERLRADVTEGLGPSEQELRSFYEDNIAQFTQGIHTEHILVEDRAQAIKLSRQLHAAKAGEIDNLFASLARKFSIDSQSAKNGGDLGTVPLGQFVPEFENAALALEQEEISLPVQSQFGFHIIRLIEKQVVPFEQAQPQILQQFPGEKADEAWREWVVDAYRDADVEVNSRYGEFNFETQTITSPGPEDIPGGEEPETPVETPSESPGG